MKKITLYFFFIIVTYFSDCVATVDVSSLRKYCLTGGSIPFAYASLLNKENKDYEAVAWVPQTTASTALVLKLARSAYTKKEINWTPEERAAFMVVTVGVDFLGKYISKFFKKKRLHADNVIIFGGVAENGGDFYHQLLLERLTHYSPRKKSVLIPSQLGDKRAIIGAVVYGKSKLKRKLLNRPYAIGVDIGGTFIRVARINLHTFECDGEIVKELVFSDENDRKMMCLLGRHIQVAGHALSNQKNSKVPLSYFLPNEQEQLVHMKLTKNVLAKLCSMIQELTRGDVAFVSVATAGLVYNHSHIVYAYNLPFTAVPFKNKLSEKLNLPVIVMNDMLGAGIGEFIAGSAKKLNKFLVVGVGTGIGKKFFEVCGGRLKFDGGSISISAGLLPHGGDGKL